MRRGERKSKEEEEERGNGSMGKDMTAGTEIKGRKERAGKGREGTKGGGGERRRKKGGRRRGRCDVMSRVEKIR